MSAAVSFATSAPSPAWPILISVDTVAIDWPAIEVDDREQNDIEWPLVIEKGRDVRISPDAFVTSAPVPPPSGPRLVTRKAPTRPSLKPGTITVQPRSGRDGSEWTKRITALERWAEGRGPLTFLPATPKRFEPSPIAWSDLPVDVAAALSRLSAALALPRVLGDAHYHVEGMSIERRLHVLARIYTWWGGCRAGEADIIGVADAITALIIAAPVPTPAPDVPENTYSASEHRRLAELVGARCAKSWSRYEVEEAAHIELRFGSFEATDSLEQRAKLAVWRAERDVRSRLKCTKLYGDPEIAAPVRLGRAPTQGRGSESDPNDPDGKRRAAENRGRRNGS